MLVSLAIVGAAYAGSVARRADLPVDRAAGLAGVGTAGSSIVALIAPDGYTGPSAASSTHRETLLRHRRADRHPGRGVRCDRLLAGAFLCHRVVLLARYRVLHRRRWRIERSRAAAAALNAQVSGQPRRGCPGATKRGR